MSGGNYQLVVALSLSPSQNEQYSWLMYVGVLSRKGYW